MNQPAAPQFPSVAHLGTYPHTQCGRATCGAARTRASREVQPARQVRVVDVVDAERPLPRGAAAQLVNGQPQSLRRVAQFIAGHDALLVEHEFGIFGGDDGEEVLGLLDGVRSEGDCVAVTVLHTVLEAPTPHQRRVVEQVVLAGWSYRRLGRELRVSPMTVQRLLRRGLEQLRQELERRGLSPDRPFHRAASAAPGC